MVSITQSKVLTLLRDTCWLPVLLWAGKGPYCPHMDASEIPGLKSTEPTCPTPPSGTHRHSHQYLEVPWSMADMEHKELPEAQTICREERCH